MRALSDQSTMTLWPSWVWTLLFIAAAAVLVMVVTRSMHERSHARRTPSPAHPARLARDTCDVTGCGYPASQWRRAISAHGPDELRHTCKGCADEGEAFGWFTTTDDLDTIEAYANGDVA